MGDPVMRISLPFLATRSIRLLLLALCLTAFSSCFTAEDEIDWDKAKVLHGKAGNGEKLSTEEQAYYDRARKAVSEGKAPFQKDGGGQPNPGNNPGTNPGTRTGGGTPVGKSPTGLIPLTELGTSKYKDEDGGLYGGGSNEPPQEHGSAAMKEIEKLQPLDADGKPSANGKIVLLGVGMSNTTQEFARFKQIADQDAVKAKNLVIVDGAQGGKAAKQWSAEDVYATVEQRLKSQGVTAQQVQVAWVKQANMGPSGDLKDHGIALKNDMGVLIRLLKKHYPNLRIAYLSSRIYGGYATTRLNPEPYAYEGAFSMRWLIQDQIKNDPQLNYDAARGPVVAPILVWGPYLWADGTTARKSDGLVYEKSDFAGDGTHPGDTGRQKVADQLMTFFKNDATAKKWFVAK